MANDTITRMYGVGLVKKVGQTLYMVSDPVRPSEWKISEGNGLIVSEDGYVSVDMDAIGTRGGYATKEEVSTIASDISANYLPLTGGTLTGSLFLASDPTGNLEAATKQYVDSAVQEAKSTLETTIENTSSTIISSVANAFVRTASIGTSVTIPIGGTVLSIIVYCSVIVSLDDSDYTSVYTVYRNNSSIGTITLYWYRIRTGAAGHGRSIGVTAVGHYNTSSLSLSNGDTIRVSRTSTTLANSPYSHFVQIMVC